MMYLIASTTEQGVDLKQVAILLFVLCVLGALGWGASKIPGDVWFIKWLAWFVLGAVGVVMVYRFLQSL